MELSDCVVPVLCGAAFLVGLNATTYLDSKKWLTSHNIDALWYEKKWEELRSGLFKDKITYYLGSPGKDLALRLYSENDEL